MSENTLNQATENPLPLEHPTEQEVEQARQRIINSQVRNRVTDKRSKIPESGTLLNE